MRRDTTIINPHQLYIELGVDELEKLNCPQLVWINDRSISSHSNLLLQSYN